MIFTLKICEHTLWLASFLSSAYEGKYRPRKASIERLTDIEKGITM